MSTPSAAPIDVRLQHAFEGGFALDLAFTSSNRSLAVFGPSGSGKTTLLHAVTGLFTPSQGRIVLGERVLFDRAAGVAVPPRERRVGLVVQDGLLFPLLTVRDNLMFGAPRERAKLTLDRVAALLEIEHLLDRRPRHLSGGERQRVALGRAVLSEPSLLLCDEPFAALDAARRRRLVPVLGRICAELHVPLVLVTHSVPEVLALAGEVVVLGHGKVVAQGPTLELLRDLIEDSGAPTNVWEGVVTADASAGVVKAVQVADGVVVHASLPDVLPGSRVRLRVPSSSIALSSAALVGVSTRNQLRGRVASLDPQDGMLRVVVDVGVSVTAMVTAGAAQELGLSAGVEVTAGFKAAATEVLRVEAV